MSQDKKTRSEEDALESALSPIVNKLIDQNFENSGDKIASQMAPLIGGAIREQIKSQKDDIVDALYPVMGNMISKFVTKSLEELLNKINEQIQNGLSVNAIKRKIKAKIKGVSETELLLQENSETKIKAVLLIHKESGSLLCKVEDKDGKLSDADMLASMMSAIRSFVNEWVNANEDHQELGEIEYGGNKIIIEASGYSYLAVIAEGAAYTKTYEKIRSVLENIVLKYGQDIKNFQGNLANFDEEGIKQELKKLIESDIQQKKQNKSKSPLLFILPLLLSGYLGFSFYKSYQDKQLKEKIVTEIEHTPQLLPFKIDVTVEDGIATIKGVVPFNYHKELLDKQLHSLKELRELKNQLQVIPTLTDPMQVSANISYLLKGINLDKDTNINYNFDYNKLTLEGVISSRTKRKELLKALKNIQGVKEIHDNLKITLPKIESEIYFQQSATTLDTNTKDRLQKISTIIKQNKITNPIELKAYSDMIGNTEKNHELAQKRVQAIVDFLHHNGIENQILTEIYDTPPPGIDPKENPKKARQIHLKLLDKKE